MFGDDKNKMHPEDTRNMFIFFVIAVLLYFTYDAFILKPQTAAIKQAQIAAQQESLIKDLEQISLPEEIRPRAEVLQESPRIAVENDVIRGSIALRGGRIDDISLKEYFDTLEKKNNVVVLSPRNTEFARFVEYGWVAEEKSVRVPEPDTVWRGTGNNKLTPGNSVTIVWENGQGLTFRRTFSLDENYLITVTQEVRNNSGKTVNLHAYGLASQTGIPDQGLQTWLLIEGLIGYIGKELHEVSYSKFYKEKTRSFEDTRGWVGINDKYWLTALVPPQGENVKYNFMYTGTPPAKKGEKDTGRFQVDFTGPALTLKPGASGQSESRLFVGAKEVLLLEQYQKEYNIPQFNLAVNFGWFWFFSKPFFYALHFLSHMTGNMGIAIILLTIGIRTAVFPLTNTSYKSFAKMKKVTPQITALREKHGADRAGLQKELVAMYEREGVNPMAGCLPMVFQIPIFFALYKVLFITIEMRHAPFFGWIQDLSAADPTSIFNLFGLIPWEPPVILHIGVWPCLMLVAMVIQKNLNPPPQDAVQRDMATYFPFLITYMMSRFASGLVIYWTFSAFIGVLQQIIIMRSLNVPIHLFGQTEDEKQLEEAVEKGPAVHPLMEMAEEDVEEAMFGDDAEKPTVSPPRPKKKKKKK